MYKPVLFTLLTSLIITTNAIANLVSFEGNINIVRESVFDTTHISLSVKGALVRIDEFDSRKKLIASKIVNLDDEVVIALSHDRELYSNIPVSPKSRVSKSNLEVNKTGNSKEINGVTCHQWRVKDVRRNTEIAYWVTEERFGFFENLLRLINRTEYSLIAYNSIPDSDNFFPMLTEERTLLRKNMLRIFVVEINEKNLDPKLFEIPSNFRAARR